jgi:translation initiation factor IF-2
LQRRFYSSMGKIRVYQLAKELAVENRELLEIIRTLGFEVKNHMSSLDEETAAAVVSSVKSPPPASTTPKKKKKAEPGKETKKSPAKETKPAPKDAKKKAASPRKEKAPKKKAVTAQVKKKEPEKKKAAPAPAKKTEPKKKKAVAAPAKKEEPKKKAVAAPAKKTEPRKKKAAPPKDKIPPSVPEVSAPPEEPKAPPRIIDLSEGITVKDLSERLGIKVNDIIKRLMQKGKMVVVNQFLDFDTAKWVAEDFGYECRSVSLELEGHAEEGDEALDPRAPVVTIMGHVDHGKTSLLDAIRESSVTEKEEGGITQHIGAYHVDLPKGTIIFLDTPGHEAFSAMRARGAEVTDIVILVVAADDGVMPQTVEAIDHAKAADVPIIVAVNKIDKPDAKPETVKTQLAEHDLIPEDWGGQAIFVEVSAKVGTGLENLMEMVLLQAEMMELKANAGKPCRGTVIESRLHRGRGPVATVLVQDGTLRVGDHFVTGTTYGKVRAILDDSGKALKEAPPSTPVEVLGLSGVPAPGDSFMVVPDERKARQVAALRHQQSAAPVSSRPAKVSLKDLFSKISQGKVKELDLVVKGDVQGSVEALGDAFTKLSTDAVKVKVIHRGVGTINEGDILLASASSAVIIGFNVRPEPKVTELAVREGVDMRFYGVIYKATEDIKKAMLGLLDPTYREEFQGRAEVRETFSVPRVGVIAGCGVLEGKITRNAEIRVLRDGIVVYEGKVGSLRRFKDDVKEVAAGYECGIGVENFNDIKKGDILETFVQIEVQPTL